MRQGKESEAEASREPSKQQIRNACGVRGEEEKSGRRS